MAAFEPLLVLAMPLQRGGIKPPRADVAAS